MNAILILTVILNLPGQGPSVPTTLRFPQRSLDACQQVGVEFIGESDEVRTFSFACESVS